MMEEAIQCTQPAPSINTSNERHAAADFGFAELLKEDQAVMVISSRAEAENRSASAERTPSPDSTLEDDGIIRDNAGIIGIAAICTCTKSGTQDHISNCTNGDKMEYCLGTQLGYRIKKSPINMTSIEFEKILVEVGEMQPENCKRAVLHLFCHGDATSVHLKDRTINRQDIVKNFQALFSDEVTKIIIFECCRLNSTSITCDAVPEGGKSALSPHDKSKGDDNPSYTVSKNMIVIETTNIDNKSYYSTSDGCGLFTKYFTKLAPTLNVSLGELLVEVRCNIRGDQIPEYREQQFHTVYMLAESRGTARVSATNVSANSSLVETTVTWVIDERVKDQVDHCYVKVMSDGDTAKKSRPTNSRIASFKGLRPNADHIAKVVTVYKGGHEVSSKACHFTTKGRVCATHVSTTSTLLKTAVTWAIDERVEDQIERCYVEVTSNNGETIRPSRHINSRMVSFSGLRPNADHTANVVIAYKDSGTVVSEDHHFRTKDIRKIYWAIFGLIVLGVISFLAVLSYTPYLYFSQLDNNGATYFISKDGTIQCGFGRSNEHRGINLKGLQKSDTSQGSISAQVIRNDALKLYSEQVGPINGGYPLYPGVHHATLPGWNNYLWEGSVISGECCVKNGNDSEATASLHLFTSDEDREQYLKGEPAEHYVLTQTINLPPTTSVCFTEWGKKKSYLVTKRAYHFFVLAVSRDNMSFDSQIRLTRKYVNISDYGNPHYFEYNTQTYFEFPNNYQHPTDYIAICHAPVSIKVFHIQSWNSPILQKLPFVIFIIFGSMGLVLATIWLVVICCCTFSVIKHLCTRHQTVVNNYRHV